MSACSSILVVDDRPANALAIQATLSELGANVECVDSGEEALRRLLRHDFALILLDVRMPGMDGFEVARLVRARQRSAHTPIIFVTATDTDDKDVLRAYALGAVDILHKPIVEGVLRAKVSVFLALHARSAESARQLREIHAHERRERTRLFDKQRGAWEANSLKRQLAHLAELDQHKTRFIAMLGHELRNPLMAMTTAVELLQTLAHNSVDAAITGEMRRTRDVFERQAQHFAGLVDDLLDVSRVSAGKVALRKARVQLQDVVQQAVAMSKPSIDARSHALQIVQPAEPIWLKADAMRLVQVVSNLLNNAARYTEPGGNIIAQCAPDGDWVEIRVTDNGRGIDPAFVERIFDPFAQEGRSSAASGGLGLGLSLVRDLVSLHGGTVAATSAGRGHGSQFTVRLPKLNVESTRLTSWPPPAERPLGRAQPQRVVLIEDDADTRELFSKLLTHWGHRVLVAANGEQGYQVVLESAPDVVLIDIGLPDFDGYAVARRLRLKRPAGQLRLVALTGYGLDLDRRRAMDAGFDLHLAKPASMDALRSALEPESVAPMNIIESQHVRSADCGDCTGSAMDARTLRS